MEGNKVVAVSLVIIVIFISGLVLRLAKPVLFPFFLAIFLSFILYPIVEFFNQFKIPKAVSIIVILILTFMIIYLCGVLLYSSGKTFASEFPNYGRKITSNIYSILERLEFERLDWQPENWVNDLNINRVGGFMISSLGTFLSFISKLFLVLIFLVFILAGRGHTKDRILKSFSKKRAGMIINVIQNIDSQIQKYLAIKTIISFFTGFFTTIILLLFGVDFAVLFGLITFALNYIPNIGSFIATVFPVIIALLQFETVWPAFWLLLILIFIQSIMGNFVEPRLMGQGLGLSPLVVLFFLFFWGWLWGIAGMILAVPIAAIVKIICTNIPELRFIGQLMSKT
ncbi:MAG: AI-2E family transporter [Candidatus Aminicenantes bacterium]|nr:AI-2E family transporter [Candidatus Aminicenantes bacterium]